MPLARVDGIRLLDLGEEYWQMIKINNQKLEKQIKEILQNSRFMSVEDYLRFAIGKDRKIVENKSL